MDIKTADKLVELRKSHGLSQEALSEKLGVSRQAISKWERGESSPDTDNLIALANIYGIGLDDLLDTEKKVQIPKVEEEEKPKVESPLSGLAKRLLKFPFPLIIAAIYVVLNLSIHMWHPLWILFILIPIYYHFAGVCFIKKKKAFMLALPIPEVVILLYLALGFNFGLWGAGAIVFIILPIYYWVVAFSKNK